MKLLPKLSNLGVLYAFTTAWIGFPCSTSAATIAGSDFSDAAVFGAPGGAYDIVNTDDLGPDDGITVNPWEFANLQSPPETNFTNFDSNSLPGMSSDQVTKINGISGAALPMIGDDPGSFATVSFSIDILPNTTIDLTDALYQGLTDTSVTFNWYAGGSGSGDIDFDAVVVNGEVNAASSLTTIDIGPAGERTAAAALGLTGQPAPNQNGPLYGPTDIGGVTVTLDVNNQAGVPVGRLDWRDRGDSMSVDNLALIGEDFIKNNNGIIRLTLEGIPAGIYNATSFHMDPDFDQATPIQVWLSDDGGDFVDTGGTASRPGTSRPDRMPLSSVMQTRRWISAGPSSAGSRGCFTTTSPSTGPGFIWRIAGGRTTAQVGPPRIARSGSRMPQRSAASTRLVP